LGIMWHNSNRSGFSDLIFTSISNDSNTNLD
jgi:hypothetical protein